MTDACKIANKIPYQNIDSLTIGQQRFVTPRIEFQTSMRPCVKGFEQHSNCAAYFSQLRKDVPANMPIILYIYKAWHTDDPKCGLFTVNAAGEVIKHRQTWLDM